VIGRAHNVIVVVDIDFSCRVPRLMTTPKESPS
jgi:hypothetical protein